MFSMCNTCIVILQDAVSAVMRVVQAIDPISHAPIAQDVVKSFIILLDQLGDDLVFFFRFWNISLQPLIIGCSRIPT